jgi:hypothetical protein
MSNPEALVMFFDLEIRNAILGKGETARADIQYCNGWDDKAGMDISCCNASWLNNALPPMVFLRDNLPDMQRWIDEADRIVSFNGIAFDAPVLAAWPHRKDGEPVITIPEEKHVDLFALAKRALGYWPNLDMLCQFNLPNVTKSDAGAMAPINWQRKRCGHVISYCHHDVWMTQKLYEYACKHPLKGPKVKGTTAPLIEFDLRDELNKPFGQKAMFAS